MTLLAPAAWRMLSASFDGQHAAVLNVRSGEGAIEAIIEVYESARSPAALACRRRLGLAGEPRVAVMLQQLVLSGRAGITLTQNPVTRPDERVIEAAWGLGEVVVGSSSSRSASARRASMTLACERSKGSRPPSRARVPARTRSSGRSRGTRCICCSAGRWSVADSVRVAGQDLAYGPVG